MLDHLLVKYLLVNLCSLFKCGSFFLSATPSPPGPNLCIPIGSFKSRETFLTNHSAQIWERWKWLDPSSGTRFLLIPNPGNATYYLPRKLNDFENVRIIFCRRKATADKTDLKSVLLIISSRPLSWSKDSKKPPFEPGPRYISTNTKLIVLNKKSISKEVSLYKA